MELVRNFVALGILTLAAACGGNPPVASVTPELVLATTVKATPTYRLLPTGILTQTSLPPNFTVVPTTPTLDPTQVTAVGTGDTPTSTPEWFGLIQIPWGVGDAGNWFFYATARLTLTWIRPPADCERYEFVVKGLDDSKTVIGTDLDPSDGISLDWEVPENLRGSLWGEALCEEGRILSSMWSGELYSGDAPPEGVCTLASGTIGVVDLFSTPSLTSETNAYLIPGVFAPVLERTEDGWYRIDESVAFDWQTSQPPTEPGWVSDKYSMRFFGPCDDVPIAD